MRILVIKSSELGSIEGLFSGHHEIVWCHSRTEAAELLKKGNFDIVIGAPDDWRPDGGGATNVLAFPQKGGGAVGIGRGLTVEIEEIESRMVEEAMIRTNQNQVQAARLLKITRGALQYKLKKYAKKPESTEEAA